MWVHLFDSTSRVAWSVGRQAVVLRAQEAVVLKKSVNLMLSP